jgi:hypothetical protein
MPPPQFRDEPESKSRGGLLIWALGGMFALLLFVVLVVVTMGQILPVLLLGGAIFGFAAFHYLVWGWWLGGRIRAEVEAEEHRGEPPKNASN